MSGALLAEQDLQKARQARHCGNKRACAVPVPLFRVIICATQVPYWQSRIVQGCRKRGKPVIVATNMLESMITNPTPTRAEVSDIAIAVREGTDAVMLSGETAYGKFPFKAVAVMATVAKRTENAMLTYQVCFIQAAWLSFERGDGNFSRSVIGRARTPKIDTYIVKIYINIYIYISVYI